MTTAIVSYDVRSLIDRWMEAEKNGDQFPVDFDVAWQLAGYTRKSVAKRRLVELEKGVDYCTEKCKTLRAGRSSDSFYMTCDAFKHFCLIAKTDEGRNIRQYFIEAEKSWQMVKSVAPELAQQIELEKLRLELERERNRGRELDSTMIQLHGDRVVLALRGQSDIIVEKETVVTEIVEPDTGKTAKFLSADQLKKAVNQRTGQKLKTAKQFTDALRDAGRDDLLIPVRRSNVAEYVSPEKLEEAIAVVFGNCRQKLIGE